MPAIAARAANLSESLRSDERSPARAAGSPPWAGLAAPPVLISCG